MNPLPIRQSIASMRARAQAARTRRLATLFQQDPARARSLCRQACGFTLDLSRQRLTNEDLQALLAHAETADVPRQRAAMFDGDIVNPSEGRRAWHTALRGPNPRASSPEIAECRERLGQFADAVRRGRWPGTGGASITDVVNIGIGGSHLGPQLACEALASAASGGPRVHFLSNIDPAAWEALSPTLDPWRTLVIVASKSWRTQETARNMQAALRWFEAAGIRGNDRARHLAGVTAAPALARASGIDAQTIFPFWDWVGGRYSLWSAIGLPVMLAIGPAAFDAMLAGAHEMDHHFRSAPAESNLPLLLAATAFWNRLLDPAATEVVAPYCAALGRLPAYLQQLQMESNGKSVDASGQSIDWHTAAAVWGAPGTDAQHSFFQALHQGTQPHPVDFILALPPHDDPEGRGLALLANALAQAQALMHGRDLDTVRTALRQQGLPEATIVSQAPHRVHAGDRVSSTLLIGRLDPASFGRLIALYEHKTVALAWLWGINPFDQWGVELGKSMADPIEAALQASRSGTAVDGIEDPTTRAWVERLGAALRRP